MTDINKARAEAIAIFEARNAESQRELARVANAETPDRFILRQERGAVCLKTRRDSVLLATPATATRHFCAKDATILARRIQNGAGEHPVPVRLSVALREDIATTQGLIDTIRDLMS